MRHTQDEAIAIALPRLSAADGANSIIYVGQGIGYAADTDTVASPIWVIVATADPTPHVGGPACEPTATCQATLVVTDMSAAVVSDETGTVTRVFNQGHIVSPSPGPSTATDGSTVPTDVQRIGMVRLATLEESAGSISASDAIAAAAKAGYQWPDAEA